MAIFAPEKMRIVMDMDGIKLHSKLINSSHIKELTKEPTPARFKQNKVDIVSPMPLEDLQTIVDSMNQYKHRQRTPEGFDSLGRGHFGTVFGYKDYAIKYVSGGQSAYSGYSGNEEKEIQDAYILRQLEDIPSVPKLYATIDNEIIIMERVHGLTIKQYIEQMEDAERMDNFIHVDFIDTYKEIMKDILMIDMMVKDLHSDNVMVCKRTGLPRIIDVGLFRKLDKFDLEERGENRDDIFFQDFYDVKDAIRHVNKLKPYITEKKYPHLLEERRAEMNRDKAIEERYEMKREMKKRKRDRQLEEHRAKIQAEGELNILEGVRGVGLNLEPLRHLHIHNDFFKQGVIIHEPMGWGKAPDNLPFFLVDNKPQHVEPVRFLPENAEQLIAMKKENNFKKGLHDKFKANNKAFIHNQHRNKFAM